MKRRESSSLANNQLMNQLAMSNDVLICLSRHVPILVDRLRSGATWKSGLGSHGKTTNLWRSIQRDFQTQHPIFIISRLLKNHIFGNLYYVNWTYSTVHADRDRRPCVDSNRNALKIPVSREFLMGFFGLRWGGQGWCELLSIKQLLLTFVTESLQSILQGSVSSFVCINCGIYEICKTCISNWGKSAQTNLFLIKK